MENKIHSLKVDIKHQVSTLKESLRILKVLEGQQRSTKTRHVRQQETTLGRPKTSNDTTNETVNAMMTSQGPFAFDLNSIWSMEKILYHMEKLIRQYSPLNIERLRMEYIKRVYSNELDQVRVSDFEQTWYRLLENKLFRVHSPGVQLEDSLPVIYALAKLDIKTPSDFINDLLFLGIRVFPRVETYQNVSTQNRQREFLRSLMDKSQNYFTVREPKKDLEMCFKKIYDLMTKYPLDIKSLELAVFDSGHNAAFQLFVQFLLYHKMNERAKTFLTCVSIYYT